MCVIGSIFREGGLDDLRESSLGKVCTRAAVPDRKRLLSFFDSMPAARKARMCPGVFAWRPNLREQWRHPSLHGGAELVVQIQGPRARPVVVNARFRCTYIRGSGR